MSRGAVSVNEQRDSVRPADYLPTAPYAGVVNAGTYLDDGDLAVGILSAKHLSVHSLSNLLQLRSLPTGITDHQTDRNTTADIQTQLNRVRHDTYHMIQLIPVDRFYA